MKWTPNKIDYIVKHYKKRGDGIKLGKKFRVKPHNIRHIIQRLREKGMKIPDISESSGFEKSIRKIITKD